MKRTTAHLLFYIKTHFKVRYNYLDSKEQKYNSAATLIASCNNLLLKMAGKLLRFWGKSWSRSFLGRGSLLSEVCLGPTWLLSSRDIKASDSVSRWDGVWAGWLKTLCRTI